MPGSAANALDGATEAPDDLGIAVERRQDPVDDRSDIVEADLQQSLCLDPLYVYSQLPQVHVDTDVEVHEIQHLRLERNVRVELLEQEMDRIHLDDRDVEEDVGIASRILHVR